jgi:hypothetical protein
MTRNEPVDVRRLGILLMIPCFVLAACATDTMNPPPGGSTASFSASTPLSSGVGLRIAPSDLGCDSIGLDYQRVTFHIDPAAAEPVVATTNTGVSLVTYWASGFQLGPGPDRVVRDPARQVVVSDGDVWGTDKQLSGYFACFGTTSLYVVLTQPG